LGDIVKKDRRGDGDDQGGDVAVADGLLWRNSVMSTFRQLGLVAGTLALLTLPILAQTPATATAPTTTRSANPGASRSPISMATQISRASVIVRARIAGWDDTGIEYAIERTIYGMPPAVNTVKFDGRLREKDLPVILLLRPNKGGGYGHYGLFLGGSPVRSLDDIEREVVEIIGAGSYLETIAEPGLGDLLAEKLERAESIVRARLLRLDDKSAYWEVKTTLRGKSITTATLEISHDLFRQRAQTMVNEAALKDDALKDPVKRDAKIDEEMKKMIAAEHSPGHEAILLLGKVEQTGESTRAELQYRLYDTSTHMKLDELERMIRSPQTVEIHL
jgi:hypothetical protein